MHGTGGRVAEARVLRGSHREGSGVGRTGVTEARAVPSRAVAGPPPTPIRRRLLDPAVAYGPAGLLALAVGVFLLAYVAVELAPTDTGVAAWWPAAGLATVAALWAPRDRRWLVAAVVVVASALANHAAGRAWTASLGFGLSNAAEALVVAAVLLRHGRPRLESLEDIFRLLAATLAGNVVMGLGGGLTVLLTTGEGFWLTARTVMTSHGAAILVVAPLGLRALGVRSAGGLVERMVQWATLTVVTLLTFAPQQDLPLSFLVVPFLVWGALRLGVRTVGAQLVLVAVVITWFSRYDGGPFVAQLGGETSLRASLVQAFLLVCALVTVPLAVSVAQRRAALERVAASERLYRQGFTDALLGMVLLRGCAAAPAHGHDGEPGTHAGDGLDVVELNEVARRMLARDDVTGTSWTALLCEEDRRELLRRTDEMRAGALDGWHGEVALAGAHGPRWVEVALSSLAQSAGEDLFVAQMVDVTARRAAEERLTAQALQDGLTGLGNRTLLRGRIDEALAALPDGDPLEADGAGPRGPGAAVLFCDLDDFKDVNDSAGHTEGDRVLVEIARRVERVLGPDDLVARIGGDEFVVLRPRASGPHEAEALAAAVLGALGPPVVVPGHSFTLGASIGIAWGGPDATADDLLRDADAAMYAAKREGKRRAVLFSDDHRARAVRAVRIEAEVRRALERGELDMFMQPVVDLRDGRTVAAEALVRWHHPERGLLGPDEWLDVVESSGLMPELGAWVLRRSCALAAQWPEGGAGPAPAVHVNVSARQLDVPGFVEVVHEVLAETGLEPGRLVLEFTETQLDTVSDALLADLASLRRAGIALAADDFGTGYSPLTRITELPISMIKVDRRFVAAMLDDVRSQAIVTTLVRLSDSLALELVAEGVETEEQAQALRMLGCPTGQGYLWSRPVPPEQFHESLRVAALRR